MIHALACEILALLDSAHGADCEFSVEFIDCRHSAQTDKRFLSSRLVNLLERIRICKEFDCDRIGEIGHLEHHDRLSALEQSAVFL